MRLGFDRMRNNLYMVFIIFGLILVTSLLSRPANANEDMEASIRECIETNTKTRAELVGRSYTNIGSLLEYQCIGVETDKCYDENNGGFRGYDKCIDNEAAAWGVLERDIFEKLLSASANQDIKDVLLSGKKAWRDSIHNDCHYMSLRWGIGLNRITDEFRCYRDKVASRAILYQIWLYDTEERLGG